MDVNSERHMEIFWKISNGPRIGDLEGGLVRKSEWVQIWGIGWRFPGKFTIWYWLGDVEGCLIRNFRWTLAWWWVPISGWEFRIDPGLVVLKEFFWKLWWWGAQAIRWIFCWEVVKGVSIGPSDGSRVRWCVYFGVLVGLVDICLLRSA